MFYEALSTRIFNFHDIMLIIVIVQYFMLALMLFLLKNQTNKANYFLAAILLCNGFQSLDIIMIWSAELRPLILDWQPNLFFWGSLGYWLQGPLLYCYVASILYKDFSLKPIYSLHLIPLVVVAILLMSQYHLLATEQKIAAMQNLSFMFGDFVDILLSMRYVIVIIYGAWCLAEIFHYRKQVLHHHANIDISGRKWLVWFVSGLVIFSMWALFVHLIGAKLPYRFADLLGLINNYFSFLFVNSLVFASLCYAQQFEGISSTNKDAQQSIMKHKNISLDEINRLNQFMDEDKPYLSEEINLSSLANKLSLSESKLSAIINQHYKKNFSEFINNYRIEEAKRILASKQNNDKSILDILAESGFSSKSNFNNVFKQLVGQTPSEYRKAS